MRLNRHLTKNFPLYKTETNQIVKLVKAFKTSQGLAFTAEIMVGTDKSKWTQVLKSELRKVK